MSVIRLCVEPPSAETSRGFGKSARTDSEGLDTAVDGAVRELHHLAAPETKGRLRRPRHGGTEDTEETCWPLLEVLPLSEVLPVDGDAGFGRR